MKNKVVLMVTSILMVVALLLASCGPKAAPTPAPAAPAPATPTPATPAPSAPAPTPTPTEKPKYGGVFNIIQFADVASFTPVVNGSSTSMLGYVYENLTNADWTRGLAGSGEIDWAGSLGKWEYITGQLAESWEIPEFGVWILNIRKDVHYALDPNSEASRLLNGRVMTADDVVWTLNYRLTDPTFVISRPGLTKNATVEKTGPWQVTLKTPVDFSIVPNVLTGVGNGVPIWTREVMDKYGKIDHWSHVVGTGPYMLTDYISGSVVTFKRNPNYWGKDPIGPGKGNQLPYPDGAKVFIIPDLSTRIASIRTGKGDWIEGIQWEDAQGLLKTNPKLQNHTYLPPTLSVAMRLDKPDLPYKDKRVRQALMLATDFETIKNEFYDGQAEIYTIPVPPQPGTEQLYMSPAEYPPAVQALFKYDPQKAKQLLAEAGYPNGFKAKMVVQNISVEMDSAALLKAMWAKVGIDLEIQPREGAVYQSITSAKSHEEMLLTSAGQLAPFNTTYSFTTYRGPPNANGSPSYVNDPVIEATYNELQKYVFINMPKADQLIRGLIPHILEQAYYIPRPTPYAYRIWQPWVKNYHGESVLSTYPTGNRATVTQWIPYPWIDQDLKEQMTGRR